MGTCEWIPIKGITRSQSLHIFNFKNDFQIVLQIVELILYFWGQYGNSLLSLSALDAADKHWCPSERVKGYFIVLNFFLILHDY